MQLLKKIIINIENRKYNLEDLEYLKEKIILNGELYNTDKDENPTTLSQNYWRLAEKIIELEDKIE